MSHSTFSRKPRGGKQQPQRKKSNKKGPGKSAPQQKKSTAPVVVHVAEQDEEQDEEQVAVPVTGVAFEGDGTTETTEIETETTEAEATEADPDAAEPETGPAVSPRRLRQAAKLGMDASDPRFQLAITSGPAFHYVEALGATDWKIALLTREDIAGLAPITPEQWVARRRNHVHLLTEEDKAAQAATWGLALDHTNVKWAMESQDNWDFARTLTSDQLNFLSNNNRKARKVPTEKDIENVRSARAKLQAEEDKKKAEAAKAAAALAKKEAHEKKKSEWADFSSDFVGKLKDRLEKEAPGLAPETIAMLLAASQSSVEKGGKAVATSPEIDLAKKIRSVENELATGIKKENKREEVKKARAEYPTVTTARLNAVATTVVDDAKLTVDDFRSLAEAERIKQRNLEGVANPAREWARLLKITLYGEGSGGLPFERLTERSGLKTHYSVDTSGINAVTAFTATTTAAELIDHLFGVAHRPSRLHVSLETGVTKADGGHALPHRYWPYGTDNAYDMTSDAGTNFRFRAPHTWGSTQTDLDSAFGEIYARLLARAQVLLDKDCNV